MLNKVVTFKSEVEQELPITKQRTATETLFEGDLDLGWYAQGSRKLVCTLRQGYPKFAHLITLRSD